MEEQWLLQELHLVLDRALRRLPVLVEHWEAHDTGSIPGSGRFHGVENGNPLQYSCLKNSMDREASQATVHGVTVRHD